LVKRPVLKTPQGYVVGFDEFSYRTLAERS